MLRCFTIFLCVIMAGKSHAQCIAGNCENGIGKVDMGYGTYSGKFVNGKPHGEGTIERIDGVRYTGGWLDGNESGEGLLYEKGRVYKTVYYQGRLFNKVPLQYQDGELAPNSVDIKGCISGDCAYGYGKLRISEQAVYAGFFNVYKFNGKGIITYSDGSYLDAAFHNDEPTQGSRFYALDNCYFEGNFFGNGSPKTGTYTFKNKGETVEIVDGYKKSPPKPRSNLSATRPCPNCKGSGTMLQKSTYNEYLTSGSMTIGRYGSVTSYSPPQYLTHTKTTAVFCSRCGGDGFLYNKLDPPTIFERGSN